MSFKREVGALLSPQGHILSIVYGSGGHVDFPGELAWSLHKKSPGIVYAFVHTHPPGLLELSGEDKSTLKAWALALYPFPARMGVITEASSYGLGSGVYSIPQKKVKMYYADLEPREVWIPGSKRKFRILDEDMPKYSNDRYPWASWLWYLSCLESEVRKDGNGK